MKNFEGLGLNSALNKSLAHMKYDTPTPIQAQAIPLALEGHDIMGTAQTGTGKTAAFAIPLVEKLLNEPQSKALVLTPTRELGKQIMEIMHQLVGPNGGIKTAFIIGGEPMHKQYKQLDRRPRLIVGTPGRINDHLERGSLDLSDANFLVLDETDRMLDMGFTVQLERIFKFMPAERQTLMFSATLPKNILKMSENYMNDPKRVSVGEVNTIAKNIKQEVIRIEQDAKYQELCTQLHERSGSVIVFIKTKYGADKMAVKLRKDGFTSEALHGDLRQNKREKVMRNFREMNFRVLIATDIAARGLDVPHIEHVVNYDLPQVAEDFIHRMGRTARAGAEGSAISFVSNAEWRKWSAIERLLDPERAANDRGDERRDGKKRKPRRSGGNKPHAQKKTFKSGKPRPEFRGDEKREDRKFNKKPRKAQDVDGNRKPHAKQDRDGNKKSDRRFDEHAGGKPRHDKPRSDKPRANKFKHTDGEMPVKKKGAGKPFAKGKNFKGKSAGPHKGGAHKSGPKQGFKGGHKSRGQKAA